MVYLRTLTAQEEAGSHVKFLTERRLTKTFPKRVAQSWKPSVPWIALILAYGDDEDVRYLKWIGAISHTDTPGQLDYSVTIDPLVRRPPMLADQGVVPVQAGALVEPTGPGLVAASPVEPAGGVPGGFGAAEGGIHNRASSRAIGSGHCCIDRRS
jgi:hypothetical protein